MTSQKLCPSDTANMFTKSLPEDSQRIWANQGLASCRDGGSKRSPGRCFGHSLARFRWEQGEGCICEDLGTKNLYQHLHVLIQHMHRA